MGQKSSGGRCIAAGSNNFIENAIVLIEGPPEPAFLARDCDDDLVQIPDILSRGAFSA
jgi:hypothetical protein